MLSGDPSAGIAEEIRGNAGRLGMQWQILSGTVQEANSLTNLFARVRLDGDAADSKAWSMVGGVLAGDRVSIIKVPPEGAYIVGWSAAINSALSDQSVRAGSDAQTTAVAGFVDILSGGSPVRISSFTKVREDTRLAYDFTAAAFLSAGTNTSVQYGLQVGSAGDFDTAFATINLGSNHVPTAAGGHFTGIPAGTYDIDARWRRAAGAGILAMAANQSLIAFRVQEVV